jgi:hypothetical protein
MIPSVVGANIMQRTPIEKATLVGAAPGLNNRVVFYSIGNE